MQGSTAPETISRQMRRLVNGTSDRSVIGPAHQCIQTFQKLGPKAQLLHPLKSITVSDDISGVQHDIGAPEPLFLEVVQGIAERAPGIVRIHDDTAENEHRIVWVDNRQVVIAGLIQE